MQNLVGKTSNLRKADMHKLTKIRGHFDPIIPPKWKTNESQIHMFIYKHKLSH